MYEQGKADMINQLTEREHQVMELICEGLSNKLIAVRLDISEHTAKFHVANAVAKMGATTRTEAAVRFTLEKAFDQAFEKALATHKCAQCQSGLLAAGTAP